MTIKRDLFDELMEGVASMKAQRNGKITLRNYRVEARTLPAVKPKMIKQVRERLRW
jgi:putative transcriptional regulator